MSDATFNRAVQIVLEEEGVFSHDVRGGDTVYGIARNENPDIPWPPSKDQATQIYRAKYWNRLRCDDIPWSLALPLFDCGVNQGVAAASVMFQQALVYAGHNIMVDGIIGNATVEAATLENAPEILSWFLALRALRYVKDHDFVTYGKGWLRRTYQIQQAALTIGEAA